MEPVAIYADAVELGDKVHGALVRVRYAFVVRANYQDEAVPCDDDRV